MIFGGASGLMGGVKLGIDMLEESGFGHLAGKRVGLLTHPAGVNSDGRSTVDILWRSMDVNLVALYGPEHGIYGDEKAEVKVDHRVDKRTGLPVYSLYGSHRRPSSQMLKGIDVMVIDLQDIGVRSYTYVSCMCYTMEECFRHGVEVVVLDRPNPLGGLKVDGPMMDRKWKSYVGVLPVPYVHGLTIGEIARICKERKGWLTIPDNARTNGGLTVVKMKGWKRNMLWPQTGLKWVATSPFIRDWDCVVGYPMTGLGCQLGAFCHHGFARGDTSHPFRMLTYPGKSALSVERALKLKKIPGIVFTRRVGVNEKTGKRAEGVYIEVVDYKTWRPTELSFHLMQLSSAWEQHSPFLAASESQAGLFNKHVGSQKWWDAVTKDGQKVKVQTFVREWASRASNYQKWSQRYWLYN